MVKNILVIYGIFAALSFIIYLPKLAQFLNLLYRLPHKKATVKRRISLVIPALNESRIIGDLLGSIEKQTYGREFFDVNIIVASADDPTVGIAERAGANVFIVPEQKCKGDALDGYFKQSGKDKLDGYAAFVIIDADAVLTPDYVEELNNALEYDAQIILTRKHIKNYLGGKKNRSLMCNCSALTYPQLDDMSNNYRTLHNIPMNMCGQGMMIRREVIEEIGGWPYRTLTEDYELRMDCYLKGFTSMYYPYAVIYTEEVLTHKQSYKRRLRWVTGFSQCDRLYKKRIKEQAKARGYLTEGEFEYFFSLVPVVIFIVTTVVTVFLGMGLTVFFAVHDVPLWRQSMLYLVALPVAVMYILVVIYTLLCMIAYRDGFAVLSIGEKIALLLFAPLFGLEYFPIYLKSRILSRTGLDWDPTERVVNAPQDNDRP